MKRIKVAGLVFILFGIMASVPVFARGGHGGGHYGGWGGHRGYYSGMGLGLGLGYGLGYYGGSYYAPYYNYPPSVITVPVAPPVYIQQAPPVVQQYPAGYWYYCNNPQGYYPYIKQCSGGWQQVDPMPSSAPR